MKALFVGLGSIGQRHLMNFQELLCDEAEILVYRTSDHRLIIKNGQARTSESSLTDYYHVCYYDDLDRALQAGPKIVVIANPTACHMATALKAAEKGCHLFIEKPISHTYDNVDQLVDIVKKKDLTVMVGYQTRFHPCYKRVRGLLESEVYGKVVSACFEWGTYLPSHHPYEDYRKSYAARGDLGGGVVLGLIHEVDLMISLLGYPDEVFACGGKLSALEIDVEDTACVLLGYESPRGLVPVNVFLSYAQRNESRKFSIQCDKATILCDLNRNSVDVMSEQTKPLLSEHYSDLKRNDIFKEEMEEFLSAIKELRQPCVSLSDGVLSLRLALEIKERLGVTDE